MAFMDRVGMWVNEIARATGRYGGVADPSMVVVMRELSLALDRIDRLEAGAETALKVLQVAEDRLREVGLAFETVDQMELAKLRGLAANFSAGRTTFDSWQLFGGGRPLNLHVGPPPRLAVEPLRVGAPALTDESKK